MTGLRAGNGTGADEVAQASEDAMGEGVLVKVEIWSDVVCPWCYIGKRRFEEALRRFPHADQVQVEWKSFELDPEAVSDPAADAVGQGPDYADRLARKYATSREQAQRMLDNMTEVAAAEGVPIHFERAVSANTFAAHQVIHLAAAQGLQTAMKERLLRAYFVEGRAVGDAAVLEELAVGVGLDAGEVRETLRTERFAPAVRADEAEARMLGITGVPFFVVDRRYGVSGAQSPEHLLQVLEKAWAERMPLTMVTPPADPQTDAAGEVCGPDGCAV